MIRALAIIAVLVALAWEYQPVMSGAMVYEDARWQDACHTSSHWTALPRSLTRWTWCAQDGQSAFAFHAVNLILHLTVGVLLYGLLSALSSSFAAGLVTALWLVHPLNVESVGYLSGRAELIAAIGVLTALLTARANRWYLAGVCVAVGVLGKESAIVAFGLVPLVYGLPIAWRTVGVMALAMLAVTLGMGWIRELWALQSFSTIATWPVFQVAALVRLSALTVFPVGQTVDYDYAQWSTAWRVCCLGAAAGMLGLAWASRHVLPLVCLGIVWVAVASLPRLIIVTPGSVFNEHQFYLPMMGWAIVAAGLIEARS